MLLVYILAAISFFYVGNAKKLSVTSVSTLTVNSYALNTLQGSIEGGTLLYIKGTGFHQNPSLNYVFVGDYPCIIPEEGVKQQTLICTTTSIYPKLGSSDLPIIVISNKEKVTAPQKFSYELKYTPEITEIYPPHQYTNQKVRIIGKHKIQDLSDGTKAGKVKGIFIGDDLCSRNGINQKLISPNENEAIQCIQAPLTEAGKYSVKEQLLIGYAIKPLNLTKTSLYGPKYEYTVFPTVQLISPNNGSIAGEQLTIKGTGFPASNKDKKKIQVTLDGTECQIVQTSVDEIKCNLKKKSTTSSKIQNSLNISQYTYASGAGFKYFNYDTGVTLDVFQSLETNSSSNLILLQSGIKGELYSGPFDEKYVLKTFEGFFYAPNSGNYTFASYFTNEFKLYLNLNPGVPLVRKASDLLIAGNQTEKTENPYSKMDSNLYKVVELQGGKHYFMKAYFKSYRINDQFKVFTEVPNNKTELGWKAPQIQKMVLNFTNQPLIYRFSSMGASSGFIKGQLLIINPNTLIVQVNISSTLPFNASAQMFCGVAREVQARYKIIFNDPQCQRFYLDENFNQLPPETPQDQVYGYEWIVKYMKPLINPLTQLPTVLPSNLFQATYIDAQSIDGSSPSFTQEKLQDQSSLINGTFKIIINGSYLNYTFQKIDFPFNLTATSLQQSLRNFFKSSEINVTQLDLEKVQSGQLGKSWTIQYNNPNSQFPLLSFDTTNLSGGAYGTAPEVHLLTVKKFSHNLLYNPLSFELMKTFTSKPSIVVSVNNISSLCLSNCQFTYLDDVPQVSSLSMNSTSILFTLSQETLKSSSKIQLKINEANACKEIKIQSNKTISCLYETSSDGLPLYTAGSYHPSIYLEGIGFLDYKVGVPQLQFDFGLMNPLPNNGSVLGSLEVTLKGKGLPLNSSDLVIKVCDLKTEIKSMSRQSLTIITPQIKYNFTEEKLNCSIKVQYEKLAPSQIFQAGQFVYNKQPEPPKILGLSKTQSNPTKKGILQILGSGFDNNNQRNVSSINVYLQGLDIDKKYQLKVMGLNDTWIKAGLSGGLTGNYQVLVEIKGKGYVKYQNESIGHFYYANTIESISPIEVSYFGGRAIEINGKCYSKDVTENEVQIGSQICSMVQASETKLKCLPPPKDQATTTMQYQVSVKSRQISTSVCNGSCSITYLPVQNSPLLTGMSTTTINSSNFEVTIQGKNLYKLNSVTQIIAIHQVSKTKFVFQPFSVNDTQIVWKTVSIPAGNYYFFVNVKDVGYSNATFITVKSKISSVTASVSTEGGILAIQGFGFPQRLDDQPFELQILEFTSRALLQPVILFHTSQLIKIQLSGRRINDKLQINFKQSLFSSWTYFVQYSDIKTPKAKIVSSPSVQWKNTDPIVLEITSGATYIPETVKLCSILEPNQEIQAVWDKNATHFWVTKNYLQPGTYRFKVFNSQSGFYQINDTFTVVLPNFNQTFSFTAMNLSVEGGHIVVGHPINSIPQSFGKHSSILINGIKTQITLINQTAIKVSYPPFIKSNKKFTQQLANPSLAIIDQEKLKDMEESKEQKTQNIDLSEYAKWSDSQNDDLTNSLFDSFTKTTYFTQSPLCYVGIYFGKHHEIEISQIRFYPNKTWQKPSDLLKGARFEGSSDNITWTEIKTLDSKIERGWNMITIKKQDRLAFRYFRFIHSAQSGCSLGEIALKGTKISNPKVESLSALPETSAILSYFDGLNRYEWTNIVFTYSDAQTPIVQNVQPPIGNVRGGQVILLSGTSLGSGTPEVLIDGKTCVIIEFNQTSIKCTTSPRLQTPTAISFQVIVGGKKAITKSKFKYVYRWSDDDTWGVDLPPVEGDLIYIPPNMHLYIDQSTPQLAGIIAQNSTVEIADQSDIQINTANLILMGAQLIAGTQEKPYQHKLTFKFFGMEGENQIPFFGNKGIGCTNCKISLHGAEKQSWTRVNSIVEKSSHITGPFLKPYGWKADDQIVVAPSSLNYLEGEKLTISQINQTSTNLEFWTKQVFKYSHSSISEQNILGNSLNGIQIGSLTRNIKIQGDQNSDSSEYGIHLTFIGNQDNGLEVKISNIELKNCGQPKKSRHCINFNRNSDLHSSYIKNSTASETYAKFISISSTNTLTISSNVGYRVKGHNIELKDGTEQNNVIQRNLMITALPYYRDLQSDVMVANYYISNPNNIVKDNVAGGSFYYGFLYDLKSKSDQGIYAKDQVCTAGYTTALNTGNVAHSIRKIGVRIKDLYSRANPCQPSRDDTLQDPWIKNPSKQSRFSGYLIYRVGQFGLMCDSIGHVTFDNFTMAQNLKNHMQFHLMNFTKEMVVVSNSTFIGTFDLANPPMDLSTKALILPRSGSIKMSNILFNKYNSNQTLVQTCSLCDKVQFYTNTGQEYFIEKVRYQNIRSARYLEMLGLARQVIYDQDGSFSGIVFDNTARTNATIIKGYKHILDEPGCSAALNQGLWDYSAVCEANITVRKITFMNILPQYFIDYFLPQIQRVSQDSTKVTHPELLSTTLKYFVPIADMSNSWSAPFVAGSTYKVKYSFEYRSLQIRSSSLFQQTDEGIIFRLLSNLSTEVFDVSKMRNLLKISPLNASTTYLNPTSCQNGEFYHNDSKSEFEVCISKRNSTLFQRISIVPVYCRANCPQAPIYVPVNPNPPQPIPQPTPTPPIEPVVNPNICIKQNFVRVWSNTSQWPSNRLPVQGQNVTVHCNWTMHLDIDPAPAAHLIIDGTLIVLENREIVNVTADSIWVRKGAWFVGNATETFDKKLIIQLNGNSDDRGLVVDPTFAGRKNLVVSGRLEIYGPSNFDEVTYLIQDAFPGSNQIKVNSANGWKLGDEIILSTSSRSWSQSQKLKIQSINGQIINISPSLSFFHHGSPDASVEYEGNSLFTASKVIYISRNIKIVSGPSYDYGFSVFVYGFLDNTQTYQMGSVYLRGVQFENGGQGGAGLAALSFKNTVTSNYSSYVSKCSFSRCIGQCVKFNNAKKFVFQNNVLYDSIRSHIRGIQMRQATISSNIMIKSRKDPTSSENVSVCLQNKEMIGTPSSDNLTINSNECYGSQDIGFILPYLPCNGNSSYVTKNIAGGCLIGFFMIKLERQTQKCLICENIMAYNCKYGILGNPKQTINLTYNKLILTGNKQGLILRFTTKEKNNTAIFSNSYLSPISDPDCANYNEIGSECSEAIGVRLLSITEGDYGNKIGYNSTQIRSSSPLDGKTFVQNVEFSYFKSNYSQNQNLLSCKNNIIFKAHEEAIDLVGSTHLYDSKIIESDKQSVAYFQSFDNKYLGLEGGCGETNCTSLQNYFIQDYSGQVLGSKRSKLLPNNKYFSNKTLGCVFKEMMNGYFCNETEQISVLQFESIARDYNTRIVWPVCLVSFSNDTINQTLNVQKEWSYRNGLPEGKRKARFNSLFKLNNTYNLTFYSRAPADMIFQIQQKSLTKEDFGWVKLVLEYPVQNSIRINANGKDMNPIILLDNQTESDPSLEVCGSYKYVYSKKYIEFILTTDCKIRMSIVNSVKASVRLDQAIGDFFTTNGTGKFIDKMCLILGITDTSRLKIVGVYTGSTVIDFYIEEQQTTTESNATSAASSSESASTVQELNQQLNQAVSSGVLQTALASVGLGDVLSLTSTVVLLNQTGIFQTSPSQNPTVISYTDQSSGASKNLIIILSVIVTIVILIIFAAIVYFKRCNKAITVHDEQLYTKQDLQGEKKVPVNDISGMNLYQFDERKVINIEKTNKNKNKQKVQKTKDQSLQNNSVLKFKNPFDQNCYPKQNQESQWDPHFVLHLETKIFTE